MCLEVFASYLSGTEHADKIDHGQNRGSEKSFAFT